MEWLHLANNMLIMCEENHISLTFSKKSHHANPNLGVVRWPAQLKSVEVQPNLTHVSWYGQLILAGRLIGGETLLNSL